MLENTTENLIITQNVPFFSHTHKSLVSPKLMPRNPNLFYDLFSSTIYPCLNSIFQLMKELTRSNQRVTFTSFVVRLAW